jgi:hypothetical protein
MTALPWVAAVLFAVFTAISVLQLVAHLRRPGREHDTPLGWMVFDVLFGLTALTLVLAQVDGAFWAVLAVYVVRRLVEERTRRGATPAR